jgi:hypothetical protein
MRCNSICHDNKSKFVVYWDPIWRRNTCGSIRPRSGDREVYGEYRGTDKEYRSYSLHDLMLPIRKRPPATILAGLSLLRYIVPTLDRPTQNEPLAMQVCGNQANAGGSNGLNALL